MLSTRIAGLCCCAVFLGIVISAVALQCIDSERAIQLPFPQPCSDGYNWTSMSTLVDSIQFNLTDIFNPFLEPRQAQLLIFVSHVARSVGPTRVITVNGFSTINTAQFMPPADVTLSNIDGNVAILFTGIFPPSSRIVIRRVNLIANGVTLGGGTMNKVISLAATFLASTSFLLRRSTLQEVSGQSSVAISGHPSAAMSILMGSGSTFEFRNISMAAGHRFFMLGNVTLSGGATLDISDCVSATLRNWGIQIDYVILSTLSVFFMTNLTITTSDVGGALRVIWGVQLASRSQWVVSNCTFSTSVSNAAAVNICYSNNDIEVKDRSVMKFEAVVIYSRQDSSCFSFNDLVVEGLSEVVFDSCRIMCLRGWRMEDFEVSSGSSVVMRNIFIDTTSTENAAFYSDRHRISNGSTMLFQSWTVISNYHCIEIDDSFQITFSSWWEMSGAVLRCRTAGVYLDDDSFLVSMGSTVLLHSNNISTSASDGKAVVWLEDSEDRFRIFNQSIVAAVNNTLTAGTGFAWGIYGQTTIFNNSWLLIRNNTFISSSVPLRLSAPTTSVNLDLTGRIILINNILVKTGQNAAQTVTAWTYSNFWHRCNTLYTARTTTWSQLLTAFDFTATARSINGTSVQQTAACGDECTPEFDCFTPFLDKAFSLNNFACQPTVCPCSSGGAQPICFPPVFVNGPSAPVDNPPDVPLAHPTLSKSTTAAVTTTGSVSLSREATISSVSASQTHSDAATVTPSVRKAHHSITVSKALSMTLFKNFSATCTNDNVTDSISHSLSNATHSASRSLSNASSITPSAPVTATTLVEETASATVPRPSDPDTSKSDTEVTANDATRGATVVSIFANPTTASSLGRLASMQSLIACELHLDVDEAVNLLSIRFGPAEGDEARGAVIGNFSLVLASVAIVVVITGIIFFKSRSGFSDRSAWQLWCDAMSVTHSPGFLVTPMTAILQPTLTSAVVLLHLREWGGDVAIATLVILLFVAYALWLSYSLLCVFPCHRTLKADFDAQLSALKSHAPVRGVVYQVLSSREKWVCPANPLWKKQHLPMFADLRWQAFIVIDTWASMLLGIVSGIPKSSATVCTSQAVLFLLVYILLCAALFMRPFMTWFMTAFMACINGLGVVAAGVLVARASSPTSIQNAAEIVSFCALVMSIVAMVKMVVDIADICIGARQLWSKLMRRTEMRRRRTMARSVLKVGHDNGGVTDEASGDLLDTELMRFGDASCHADDVTDQQLKDTASSLGDNLLSADDDDDDDRGIAGMVISAPQSDAKPAALDANGDAAANAQTDSIATAAIIDGVNVADIFDALAERAAQHTQNASSNVGSWGLDESHDGVWGRPIGNESVIAAEIRHTLI